MDEALREAFQNTDYLVCLSEADWAVIRIDQPLPAALQASVGDHAWGFLTAWNPQAKAAAEADNRAAQQHLLATLRALPTLIALHPAIGIGAAGWYEPSLFVIGPDTNTLDALGAWAAETFEAKK